MPPGFEPPPGFDPSSFQFVMFDPEAAMAAELGSNNFKDIHKHTHALIYI